MFFPTTRPCEPGPGHRPPQTVLHRHLLRMHRALTEVFRQNGDVNQSIPETTLVRLNKVLRSADHGTCEASCTLQAALAIVDTLTQKQEKTTSSLLSQAWRHKFRVVSQDIWKPAKSVLKLSQLTAAFSADETRANWSQHWCSQEDSSNAAAGRWLDFAENAAYHRHDMGSEFELPTRADFWKAALQASGSAGFDGWTTKEMIAIQKHLTPFADELNQQWCQTSTLCSVGDNFDPELRSLLWLWPWKVVGIPKKVPTEPRPPLAWPALWCAFGTQHCCASLRKDNGAEDRILTSVTHATASFFARNLYHIAETDLSKAFDHLWPPVACQALTFLGTPKLNGCCHTCASLDRPSALCC